MKRNLLFFVLAALLAYLLLDKVGIIGTHDVRTPDTTIVRDTVWHETNKTVVREIQQVGGDEGFIPPGEDMYIATDSYDSLLNKFNVLVKELTARKFYKDSLQLDSIGYIVVKDTVQFNTLQKRSYNYFYKVPHVTETVTITKYAPATRQLFLGAGLGKSNFQAGLLYKTRKDLLFGAYVAPPLQGVPLQFGVQAYWKIKLKK
jgi:hypothetical protein